MKKYILLTISFLILLIVYIFFSNSDDVLNRKEIRNYLFNTTNFRIEQDCYEDLIGLSTDGAFYDFYKYKIFDLDTSNLSVVYPKFDNIFKFKSLSNIDYLHWNKTPISETGYHFDIAFASNLNKSNCTKIFQEKDYLRKSGNYYSFISAYPIGVYLFIYSPYSNELFIIAKK